MNIFVLSECPIESAQMMCDKHVVKMVTESAQMLSTAHRLLDGKMIQFGKAKRWKLDDDREDILFHAVHMNHPCTLWTMESSSNYAWHYDHYYALAREYERRYGKEHGSFSRQTQIGKRLRLFPNNIPRRGRTPFAVAMKNFPQCIVPNDVVESYRNYYRMVKRTFAVWDHSETPAWYK